MARPPNVRSALLPLTTISPPFRPLYRYWGSLGEAATLVPNLKGYLVNRDSGALGQAMIQAFQQNTLGVGVPHNAHQTWIILDQSTLTNQQVEDAVFNEVVWNAVIGERSNSLGMNISDVRNNDSGHGRDSTSHRRSI